MLTGLTDAPLFDLLELLRPQNPLSDKEILIPTTQTELTTVFSCWAVPCCAGRVVAQLPGEQLSRCEPHTQCTAEEDAPCWAATAGRTAVCCPPPAAGEYQEIQALQHLHGGRQTGGESRILVYYITLVRNSELLLLSIRFRDNIRFHFRQI